ncbi:MAG: protein kinase [Proteobacteria bacterium]|nr:protein kinase [Pseudomonadota bacterium]
MARMMGRYELLRPLGRGGMAEIFLARRRGPGGVEKRLVVKRIRRERARDPRFVAMFVREAQLSMSLAHKNIVPVFDFGRAGNDLFLVMEHVEGLDLGAALKLSRMGRASEASPGAGALDPLLAGFIAIEACQALDYAHNMRDSKGESRPVIHRDVTPRNVLVSVAGEVKLLDFGLATHEVDAGGSKLHGTPAYMAPEQAQGKAVDGRADLFSLGLMLWEVLAGRRAYGATELLELLEMARTGHVPPLPGHIPVRLREIVARATNYEVGERYQSARAMQMDLDAYVVAERARSSGELARPPGHQLAEWVQAAAANGSRQIDWAEIDDVPDGHVVTFLDHGESGLEASAAADSVLRSLAETIAEEDASGLEKSAGEPDAENMESDATDLATASTRLALDNPRLGAPDRIEPQGNAQIGRQISAASETRRRRSAVWWAVFAIGAALAIGAVWLVQGMGSEPRVQGALGSKADPAAGDDSPRVSGTAGQLDPAGQSVDTGPARSARRAASGKRDRTAGPDVSASNARRSLSNRPKPAGSSRVVRDRGSPGRLAGRVGAVNQDQSGRPESGQNNSGGQKNRLMGVVRISTSPWAKVTVVGRGEQCRDTPCQLSLPPGTYTFRLHNPVKNVGKEVTVQVAGNQTVTVQEILTRAL